MSSHLSYSHITLMYHYHLSRLADLSVIRSFLHIPTAEVANTNLMPIPLLDPYDHLINPASHLPFPYHIHSHLNHVLYLLYIITVFVCQFLVSVQHFTVVPYLSIPTLWAGHPTLQKCISLL